MNPQARKEILDILQKIKGTTTVIFSTHILSDVERICDRVAVLHNGSIAISGTLSEIKTIHGKERLLLEFSQKSEVCQFKACERIKPLLSQTEESGTEIILQGKDIVHIQRVVISVLAETGLCPSKMEIMESSLENLFLEVVM
jgi:ABC-2 type transport system ATP-binding protein